MGDSYNVFAAVIFNFNFFNVINAVISSSRSGIWNFWIEFPGIEGFSSILGNAEIKVVYKFWKIPIFYPLLVDGTRKVGPGYGCYQIIDPIRLYRKGIDLILGKFLFNNYGGIAVI